VRGEKEETGAHRRPGKDAPKKRCHVEAGAKSVDELGGWGEVLGEDHSFNQISERYTGT